MEDSIAHPRGSALFIEAPAWKTLLAAGSAILLGLLFVVAGVWKITDPFGAAQRMTQALVPHALSMPAALALGISETFAGILLFVPRFRRWGAWISGLLLIAFMVYIGVFYNQLRGEECNCFPWLRRAVGPAFFIGDAVMLLLAVVAGVWSKNSSSRKTAVLILAAVSVFAGTSFGLHAVRMTSVIAPATIHVEDKAFPLHQGSVFLYFFDPECAHCDMAAREMATYNWLDVKVIAVPTARPEFARQFVEETKLNAPITADAELLRRTFKFTDPPYAVALDNGRQIATFSRFEAGEPATGLRKIGFIH